MERPEGGGKQRLRQPSAVIPGLRFPLLACLQLALVIVIAGIGACAGCRAEDAAGFIMPPGVTASEQFGLVLTEKNMYAYMENRLRHVVPRDYDRNYDYLPTKWSPRPAWIVYRPGFDNMHGKWALFVPRDFCSKTVAPWPPSSDSSGRAPRVYINHQDYLQLGGDAKNGTPVPGYVLVKVYPQRYDAIQIGQELDIHLNAKNNAEFCATLVMICHLIPGVNSALAAQDNGVLSVEFARAALQDAMFFTNGPVKLLLATGAWGFCLRDMQHATTNQERLFAVINMSILFLDIHSTVTVGRPRIAISRAGQREAWQMPLRAQDIAAYEKIAPDPNIAAISQLPIASYSIKIPLFAKLKEVFSMPPPPSLQPREFLIQAIENLPTATVQQRALKDYVLNLWQYKSIVNSTCKITWKNGDFTAMVEFGKSIVVNPYLSNPNDVFDLLCVLWHEHVHIATRCSTLFDQVFSYTSTLRNGVDISGNKALWVEEQFRRLMVNECLAHEAESSCFEALLKAGANFSFFYKRRLNKVLKILNSNLEGTDKIDKLTQYLDKSGYGKYYRPGFQREWNLYSIPDELSLPGDSVKILDGTGYLR